MEAITLSSYNDFNKWSKEPWLKKAKSMNHIKNVFAKIIDMIYLHLPHLKNKLVIMSCLHHYQPEIWQIINMANYMGLIIR